MRKAFFVTLLAGIVALGFAGTAKADDIQIVCTGLTTCTAGGVQTTSNSSPTFVVNISGNAATGELRIAIAQPVSSGANFTSANSSMWQALGLTGGQDHNFQSTVSNDGGFFAGNTGFFVTTFDTGQTLGGHSTSGPITLPSAPYTAGTIFIAFTTNNTGGIIINSPWSESLLVTNNHNVPEPASLTLLGLGLLGVPFLRRKK